MILSRRLLSLGDVPCSTFENIPATLDKAQEALDLVAQQQFANTTLEQLQASNTDLNFTTSCVERKEIKPDDSTAIKEAISAAETSGEAASDTIDHANPTPPTPEDDSGFRSATIALGVLFSLAVVAIAGLAIYAQRQKSGGHMS
ncbi:hypothetical protein FJT64_023239 [Amphibalanus amphitrite]|uniref:Uncharacterized protein n=1 Tax=Amphibalanus amphitrite TaxID=1232801 RepID=A0A6A4WMN3_AMPAM|nr:hypothetical protein FJT64_023239 [Amphibalanus amphitrite]